MATLQARGQEPVGSAQWTWDEQRHAAGLVAQEVEEFTFSALNEFEWLNEHMAEVFAKAQLYGPKPVLSNPSMTNALAATLRKSSRHQGNYAAKLQGH